MKQTGKIIRKLLYSLIPIQITSCMGLFLSNLIDTVIVGKFISNKALATIGFAMPLTLVFNMIAGVIATGSQILGGYHMGRGETEKVNGAFSGCLSLSVLIGAAGTLLCLLFANPLAALLGASGDTTAQTAEYIRGLCLGLIFWLFYKSMLAFLQMEHAPAAALIATIVMAVSKVGFDLLFVLVLNAGVLGVGLATSLSYLLAFLVGWIFYRFCKHTIRFSFCTIRASVLLTILGKGIPNAVQEGCGALRGVVINRLAVYFGGEDAVSVYTFASNVAELFFSGISGTASAADILNSIFAGTRDRASLKQVNRYSIKAGTVINVSAWVLVMCIAGPVATLSGAEGAQLAETALAIRLLFSAALANVIPTLSLHFYRTLGCIGKVNLISVLQLLVFHLTVCATLPRLIGTAGIWISYLIGDFLIAALIVLYSAKKLGFFPKKLTQIIFIPHKYGTPEDAQWDGVLSERSEIPALCEQAKAFVSAKGASEERADAFETCLRELLSNVVSYGSASSCDVRVVCENGESFFVLRDNGTLFDPTEVLSDGGLKTVRSLSKSMKYRTTLGLNVLTVEL